MTQTQIIKALGVQQAINPAKETNRRINFLKNILLTTPINGFVLGVSGGADSALTGWIAAQAIKETNKQHGTNYELHTITLPYKTQKDADDAKTIIEEYIKPTYTFNINVAPGTDNLVTEYQTVTNLIVPDHHKGNVKCRERMVTLYLHAGIHNLLVLGTDNAAEMLTGFYTKFGDGAYDVNPIQTLTKTQVKLCLSSTKAPHFLQTKVPTADLLDTQEELPDEEALGVTYEEIDAYLTGYTVTPETQAIIERQYEVTQHKRNPPVIL